MEQTGVKDQPYIELAGHEAKQGEREKPVGQPSESLFCQEQNAE
jgi:hypothetical protein